MGNANGQINSMRPAGKDILYPSIKPYV